jgi:hypothetical protein
MASPTTRQDSAVLLDSQFQRRHGQVIVLAQRADAQGLAAITTLEDMIPLLFPHTTTRAIRNRS